MLQRYAYARYITNLNYINSNNPNDPDSQTILNCLIDKYKVQIEQTGLTGALPFNYDKNLRLPIPSKELQNNPYMIGNSAN